MFRPGNRRALIEIIDKLGQAFPLHTVDCERLACGFVGINVVCDVTIFFWGILCQWKSFVVAPELTYADLHPILCETGPWSAEVKDPSPIVGLEAAKQLCTPPLDKNPWRRVNTWLARDAILRLWKDGCLVTARPRAEQDFADILSGSEFTASPCNTRSSTVVRAFQAWWTAWCGQLAEILRDGRQGTFVENDPAQQRQATALSLADRLADSVLLDLVKTKNNQLTNCIQQLNKVHGSPVPSGSVALLTTQWLAALEANEDYVLQASDIRTVKSVIDSVGRQDRWPRLEGIARQFSSGDQIPSAFLPTLVGEWQEVERTLRMRGLPANWGQSRLVADLLFFPLPLRVDRWCSYVQYFGFSCVEQRPIGH